MHVQLSYVLKKLLWLTCGWVDDSLVVVEDAADPTDLLSSSLCECPLVVTTEVFCGDLSSIKGEGAGDGEFDFLGDSDFKDDPKIILERSLLTTMLCFL